MQILYAGRFIRLVLIILVKDSGAYDVQFSESITKIITKLNIFNLS